LTNGYIIFYYGYILHLFGITLPFNGYISTHVHKYQVANLAPAQSNHDPGTPTKPNIIDPEQRSGATGGKQSTENLA
jgi:hypothetical protein